MCDELLSVLRDAVELCRKIAALTDDPNISRSLRNLANKLEANVSELEALERSKH